MHVGTLRFEPLNETVLYELFPKSPASFYLRDYLSYLQASAVLIEPHYIDRHFLDDFTHYYARSFNPPDPWCERVHFFKGHTGESLKQLFRSAYDSIESRDRVEGLLQESYLGFVVKRPLVGAAIGRTVLKTYPVDGRRHYSVVRPYEVHVAGLRLKVNGLAYQQQDRGAAVCASTALWSALQRVARVAGHRTPTPSGVTRAASSPFPASSGLDQAHMATALASLGYIADRFAPMENRPLFRALIVACLESQLPVVLLITKQHPTGAGEVPAGHAVCVTGFSEPKDVSDVPALRAGGKPIQMKGGAVEVLYVHDDNLGSHAHYEIFDNPDDKDLHDGFKKLMLRRGRSTKLPAPANPPANPPGEESAVLPISPAPADWWNPDVWTIFGAIVPKPDKLRLPVRQLFYDLIELRRLVELVFEDFSFHYSPHFAQGIDYKRNLVNLDLDRTELATFIETPLPRHVGIIGVYWEQGHMADLVLDVSEVERDLRHPPVIAIVAPGVANQSPLWKLLTGMAAHFSWPVITGPMRPQAGLGS